MSKRSNGYKDPYMLSLNSSIIVCVPISSYWLGCVKRSWWNGVWDWVSVFKSVYGNGNNSFLVVIRPNFHHKLYIGGFFRLQNMCKNWYSTESELGFEDRYVSSGADFEEGIWRRVSCRLIVGWILGKKLECNVIKFSSFSRCLSILGQWMKWLMAL